MTCRRCRLRKPRRRPLPKNVVDLSRVIRRRRRERVEKIGRRLSREEKMERVKHFQLMRNLVGQEACRLLQSITATTSVLWLMMETKKMQQNLISISLSVEAMFPTLISVV